MKRRTFISLMSVMAAAGVLTLAGCSSSSSSTAVISDDGQYSQDNSASSSDVTVHITKTGEKYHSAGCQYLKKSDIEVTLSEAKARGLTPCSRCNPPQ